MEDLVRHWALGLSAFTQLVAGIVIGTFSIFSLSRELREMPAASPAA